MAWFVVPSQEVVSVIQLQARGKMFCLGGGTLREEWPSIGGVCNSLAIGLNWYFSALGYKEIIDGDSGNDWRNNFNLWTD